jgi:3-phosphoshikimate 1-carboxyvinyltransferase
MAAAVAALGAADPITIDDDEAVAVTFPDFFPLLESIRKV